MDSQINLQINIHKLLKFRPTYRCRDRYVQECQQLQKENDEQRDQLNEAIKKGKETALTLQRCMKEQQNLSKQLEAAQIEVKLIAIFYSAIWKDLWLPLHRDSHAMIQKY